MAGTPTWDDTTEISPSWDDTVPVSVAKTAPPQSSASRVLTLLKSAAESTAKAPARIFTNPISRALSKAGQRVEQSVEGVAGRIAEAGAPITATGVSMLGSAGALTPENMAIAVGAEALPVVAAPLASRAERVAKSVGNKFIGTPLKSLKKSIREGTETLGEKYLKSDLPSNREEAFAVASNKVDDFEAAIQEKLKEASKKIKLPSIKEPAGDVVAQGTLPTYELPSGGKIARYGDPKVGTIQRWLEPSEQGLVTPGKKFTKGESKGVFNPGEAETMAKQTQFVRDSIRENIKRIRKEFAERAASPQYRGMNPDFAIGKEKVANGFQKAIDQAKKIGTEDDTVKSLEEMKSSFLQSHPDFADAMYWNDIKREIYRLVGDNGYLTQTPTAKVKALKNVAKSIKLAIEEIVPGIKQLNIAQGEYLSMRDSLGDVISATKKNIPSLRQELKDEAKVAAARNAVGKNLHKTRFIGGAAASSRPGYFTLKNLIKRPDEQE